MESDEQSQEAWCIGDVGSESNEDSAESYRRYNMRSIISGSDDIEVKLMASGLMTSLIQNF